MREFSPTYLYIKQHTITGKLYFGKAARSHEKMLQYPGSGKYWSAHIRKHGRQFVTTLWFCLFLDKEECKKFALMCSSLWDIVKSNNWANFKIENGLDGGHGPHTDETKAKIRAKRALQIMHPVSKETREKMRISMLGKNTGPSILKGRAKSEEHKQRLSAPKKQIICPQCGKSIGGQSNYNRWHGDKCKNV